MNLIEEVHGNLLEADVDALVNTVNTVGVMGKGIALQFKRAFPRNFAAYSEACARGEVRLGEMFTCEVDTIDNPAYIINFPTKAHWKSKSKLDDIRRGLRDLRTVVVRLGIRSVAVPPLGCGNGGLSWSDVYPMIKKEFSAVDGVRFLVYPPDGPPDPERMPNVTERPSMTPIPAALLSAFNRYMIRSIRAGLSDVDQISIVESQKVAYFLQVAGWPMGLEFSPRHFGPYSHTVDRLISEVEGHFVTGYGDGSWGSKATIKLDADAIEEAQYVLEANPDYHAALDRLEGIIEGFEFPYGMELLATVHFVVARHDNSIETDEIVREIRAWSQRKGAIFQEEQVRLAHEHLIGVAPPVTIAN